MTFTFLQDSTTLQLAFAGLCHRSLTVRGEHPSQREPHAHGHERRTEFDGEAGGENARATKEFPAHFHNITTNMTAIIAENASRGAVSGLSHVTLRMLSRLISRICCSCLRARESCQPFCARSTAFNDSCSALGNALKR